MNQTTVQGIESSKRMAFNLICSTASHFLSAVIAFVITPFLIAKVGMEAYGFYPISSELMAFFGLFTGIVNSTASRYITVEDARGNGHEASQYFSTVFFSNVFLCALLLIPMGLFVAFVDQILSVPGGMAGELRVFFALVLASVIVNALSTAFGSAYSVSNRMDLRSAQDFIAVLLKAAILFGLLGGGFSSSIISIGIALLISNAAGAFIQFLMCRRLTPELTLSWRNVSRAHAGRVFASGLWYTLDRLGAFLMTGGLLILSNMLFTAEGVGVYSVSVTASRAMSGVLLMVAGVFLPVTAKHFARGEQDRLRADIIRDQKVTGFFAAVGVAFAIGFCDEFFTLWLSGDNSQLLRVLTILSMLPLVSIAAALPIVNLGVVMDRMRRLSLLFVGSGLLTLAAVITVSCFTKAGVLGVAVISSAAQLVWYTVLVPLFAARLLHVRAREFYAPMLKSFLACGLSVALVFVVKNVSPVDTWLRLIVMGGACLVVSLVLSFLCIFGKPKFKI